MSQEKLSLQLYKKAKKILTGSGLGNLYVFQLLNNFILNRLNTGYVEVQGHKMFLDSKDSMNLSINGVYEEFETGLFQKEIKKGDVILDIGANIGYFTLIFANLVGETGKVYAFEPDSTNFSILEKNIKLNGYNNIILINKAVSDNTGKLKLFLSDDSNGDHRTYDSNDGRELIEIDSVSIDDYFSTLNKKVNFIKMDIQGAEYFAIKGMVDVLNSNEKIKMLTEFWPVGFQRSGVKTKDYLDIMLKHGFDIIELEDKENQLTPIHDIEFLLEKYTVEKENFGNLLFEKNK